MALSLAMLVATAGLASADPGSASRQQAINLVIQRALSQQGVPFSYGGGNVSGPSLGVERTTTAPVLSPGLTPPVTSLGLGLDTTPSTIAVAPAPTVGFDASGLVVYAFGAVGIKMPRSSGEQYKVGRKILPDQALPGDLLFYGPDGTQSVAMFVGNGQMVEATDPVVKVSPVRTGENMAPYLSRIIEW